MRPRRGTCSPGSRGRRPGLRPGRPAARPPRRPRLRSSSQPVSTIDRVTRAPLRITVSVEDHALDHLGTLLDQHAGTDHAARDGAGHEAARAEQAVLETCSGRDVRRLALGLLVRTGQSASNRSVVRATSSQVGVEVVVRLPQVTPVAVESVGVDLAALDEARHSRSPKSPRPSRRRRRRPGLRRTARGGAPRAPRPARRAGRRRPRSPRCVDAGVSGFSRSPSPDRAG